MHCQIALNDWMDSAQIHRIIHCNSNANLLQFWSQENKQSGEYIRRITLGCEICGVDYKNQVNWFSFGFRFLYFA